MPISAILFDVGGVLLTNGWDRQARLRAAERFGLDWDEFQRRHSAAAGDLETGRLPLDDYLNQTIFHRQRPFARDEFWQFMQRQSRPNPESLAIAEALARSGQFLLATLNNESRELNRYRIDTFGLRRYFQAFFSSCYLGMKKPEERLYRVVLEILQRPGSECLFIDDRPENAEAARAAGIAAIHYQGPADLRDELQRAGISAAD